MDTVQTDSHLELLAENYAPFRGITRAELSDLRLTAEGDLVGMDPGGLFKFTPGSLVAPITDLERNPNVICSGWTESSVWKDRRDVHRAEWPS